MVRDVESTTSLGRRHQSRHRHSNAQSLLLLGSLTLIATLFLRILFSEDSLGIIFTFILFGSGLAMIIIGFSYMSQASSTRHSERANRPKSFLGVSTQKSHTLIPVSRRPSSTSLSLSSSSIGSTSTSPGPSRSRSVSNIGGPSRSRSISNISGPSRSRSISNIGGPSRSRSISNIGKRKSEAHSLIPVSRRPSTTSLSIPKLMTKLSTSVGNPSTSGDSRKDATSHKRAGKETMSKTQRKLTKALNSLSNKQKSRASILSKQTSDLRHPSLMSVKTTRPIDDKEKSKVLASKNSGLKRPSLLSVKSTHPIDDTSDLDTDKDEKLKKLTAINDSF